MEDGPSILDVCVEKDQTWGVLRPFSSTWGGGFFFREHFIGGNANVP